jgi:hypothetical protein
MECVFKDINFVPNGSFVVKPNRAIEVMRIIMNNYEPALYTNKREVVMVLGEAVKNGESIENQIQHVGNVQDLLGKDRIFD